MQVSLFVTCLGDRFFAKAAADAVRLLRSLDVEVDFPRNQTCCGQPAWNSGHIPQAREMAAHTAAVFADADYVVLPSGSCAAMLRTPTGVVYRYTRVAMRPPSPGTLSDSRTSVTPR